MSGPRTREQVRVEEAARVLMARMIEPVPDSWERSEDQWNDYFCERAALAVNAAEHLIYQLDHRGESLND